MKTEVLKGLLAKMGIDWNQNLFERRTAVRPTVDPHYQ